MIILTTAIGLSAGDLSIFWDSLMETGYKGKVVVFGEAKCLEDRGAIMIPYFDNGYGLNFKRWKAYSDFLKDVNEPVVITDIRDVVFQKNPEEFMPLEGTNVFTEDGKKIIGTCFFNSCWLENIGITKWHKERIICAGVSSGHLKEYSQAMWNSILELKPLQKQAEDLGGDQAIHNNLIYSGFPAVIHNQNSEVYTVGHLPKESVKINEDGFIINEKGEVPCMVHMYDRHVNLTASVIQRLNLRVELQEA